mmetsp:Transcript_106206/g.277368  ORF Transcript_106206/g.277368 Transcript_106206/m.277368 type:complete len:252 (+) Transcript_106206:103-858(+)
MFLSFSIQGCSFSILSTTLLACLSSFWSSSILCRLFFCSSSCSSRCWRFAEDSAASPARLSSSFLRWSRMPSSFSPSRWCASLCFCRLSFSACVSASKSPWLCTVAWSFPSCASSSPLATSYSTWRDSNFSRCFSIFSACFVASPFNRSTCSSRCLMRPSRPESRLLMSFSNNLTCFSSCFFSSGMFLSASSSDESCSRASCSAVSEAWCALRLMVSCIRANSCSLTFSSCSSAAYWVAAALFFSSWARSF